MDVLLRSWVVITPSFRLRPRALFFRTAAALWAISNASRPVTTASARTARRPMQLVSTGGSHLASACAISWASRSCASRRLRTIRVRSRGRNVFASLTNLSVSAKAARTNGGSRTGTSTKSTVSSAARKRGDMAQSIHDHAIDVTSDVLRVAVKRVPRETDDSEAPRQPFLRPHLGPLKRAALRVRIDYGDVPSPVRPEAGGVQRQRHLADPVRLVEERDDHGSPPDDARNEQWVEDALVGRRWHDKLDALAAA